LGQQHEPRYKSVPEDLLDEPSMRYRADVVVRNRKERRNRRASQDQTEASESGKERERERKKAEIREAV